MPGLSGLAFSGQSSSLSPSARDLADRLIGRLGALKLAGKWSEALPVGIASTLRAAVCGSLLLFLAVYSPLRSALEDPRPTTLQPQQIAHVDVPELPPVESPKPAPRDPKTAAVASSADPRRRKQAERKALM